MFKAKNGMKKDNYTAASILLVFTKVFETMIVD